MDFGLKKIFTDTLSKSTQVQQKKSTQFLSVLIAMKIESGDIQNILTKRSPRILYKEFGI